MINILGCRQDFQQFVLELSSCLPPSITIEGSIFGSANDYILYTTQPGCQHDLMIGADLDGADGDMDQTNLLASRTSLPAIALVKRGHNSTVVCRIENGQEWCLQV